VISLIVFLISLPLTVYTLAGCLQIIDQQQPAGRFRAVLNLSLRVGLFAILVLTTPVHSRIWILAGVFTALMTTTGFQLVVRYLIRTGRWPTGRMD
jgi:hypothetical protein